MGFGGHGVPLNPKPQTLNPKPQTLNPKLRRGASSDTIAGFAEGLGGVWGGSGSGRALGVGACAGLSVTLA